MGNGYSLRLFTKPVGSQCQADFDSVKHLGTPKLFHSLPLPLLPFFCHLYPLVGPSSPMIALKAHVITHYCRN